MRFALVDNEKVEASPALKGVCTGCGEPVSAKCGEKRVWHWAHKADTDCDRWWETETEWHRNWKNNFLQEWQESVLHDKASGEKHIADVRTSHGLVIEFQHSRLDSRERDSRERFYGNMIWVVDGTRLKSDYLRFQKGNNYLIYTRMPGYFLLARPQDGFPSAWLDSKVPVIFDFKGSAPVQTPELWHETLWCLIPGRAAGYAVVVGMARNDFVAAASSRAALLPTREIIDIISPWLQQQRTLARTH